jgi:cellobiose phosphorylase
VEPYVISGDVYSVAPHRGRGGWSWYTGAAGWSYRAGLEAILGIRRAGTRLTIHPCVPKDWAHHEVTYRHGDKLIALEFVRERRNDPLVTALAPQSGSYEIDLDTATDGARFELLLT